MAGGEGKELRREKPALNVEIQAWQAKKSEICPQLVRVSTLILLPSTHPRPKRSNIQTTGGNMLSKVLQ